jgi:hypothetical protein
MTVTKVTPNEIDLGQGTSSITTDETTTSTTYADLTTPGPAVVANIGKSGAALITISAGLYTGATGKFVSVAISGATTKAPYAAGPTLRKDDAPFTVKSSITYLETGLTPGIHTFTMKYKVSGGTGNFFDRMITVVPV